jgi:para-nitrobenzyl esterase
MCTALVALALAASGAAQVGIGSGPSSASDGGPIVITSDGAVRGVAVPGGYAFRGLPYAAPPTGDLRWRAPRRPASWSGIRDATQYAPSCLQKPSLFQPPGPQSEDCLYLNVSTSTLGRDAKPRARTDRPATTA